MSSERRGWLAAFGSVTQADPFSQKCEGSLLRDVGSASPHASPLQDKITHLVSEVGLLFISPSVRVC